MNTLPVATLLIAGGRFLDSYAWVAHGHMFTNAISGNVTRFGVFAAEAMAGAVLTVQFGKTAVLFPVALPSLILLSCVRGLPKPIQAGPPPAKSGIDE